MFRVPGFRAPKAKDCADCRFAECGLELYPSRFCGRGPPRSQLSLADSESSWEVTQIDPLGSFAGHF
eukprot:2720340-Alexandrium_andersonii.AAC.1